MTDYRITSIEALRKVVVAPKPSIETKVFDHVDHHASEFIGRAPLCFVATYDAQGNVDVSPKGDAPGFVEVKSPHMLLLPERKGNRLTYGFRNILETGRVGLIFMVPGVREALRVNGKASLTNDPEILARLAAEGKPALLATEVAVDECFFHCGKAFIRSKLWQSDTWATDIEGVIAKQIGSKLALNDTQIKELDAALEANYKDELY